MLASNRMSALEDPQPEAASQLSAPELLASSEFGFCPTGMRRMSAIALRLVIAEKQPAAATPLDALIAPEGGLATDPLASSPRIRQATGGRSEVDQAIDMVTAVRGHLPARIILWDSCLHLHPLIGASKYCGCDRLDLGPADEHADNRTFTRSFHVALEYVEMRREAERRHIGHFGPHTTFKKRLG